MNTGKSEERWEQHMRKTNHPEFTQAAEELRRCPGVRRVTWLYDDRYTVYFEWEVTDQRVDDALSVAAEHRYGSCERESHHIEQNCIDIEYRAKPIEISIH